MLIAEILFLISRSRSSVVIIAEAEFGYSGSPLAFVPNGLLSYTGLPILSVVQIDESVLIGPSILIISKVVVYVTHPSGSKGKVLHISLSPTK